MGLSFLQLGERKEERKTEGKVKRSQKDRNITERERENQVAVNMSPTINDAVGHM